MIRRPATSMIRRPATKEELEQMRQVSQACCNMYHLGEHGVIGCGGSVYHDGQPDHYWIPGKAFNVLPTWAEKAYKSNALVLLCHPNLIKTLSSNEP